MNTFPDLFGLRDRLDFQWEPALATGGIALIVGVVVMVAIFNAWRARSKAGLGTVSAMLILRLTAITTLGVLLLNPSRVNEEKIEHQRVPLLLLLDTSESMCVEDEAINSKPATRLATIQHHWLAEPFLARLNEEARPTLMRFDVNQSTINFSYGRSLPPTGHATRLVQHVGNVLRSTAGRNTSGMILLTDGRDTTGATVRALESTARSLNVPIHVVSVGRDTVQPDVWTALTPDHSFVYRGQTTILRATIEHRGFVDTVVEAVLEENGIEIARRRIRLGSDAARLSFDVSPQSPPDSSQESGLASYRFRVELLPGEVVTANNTRHAFIQISDEHIRIALFEDKPYWDTRFLIAALRNDAQIDLTTIMGFGRNVHVTRYTPGLGNESDSTRNTAPSVPQTTNELAAYDIIILGRGVERWFPATRAELLRDFVTEQGGSLIFARGRPMNGDTPEGRASLAMLDAIAPVIWGEGFAPGSRLWRTPEGEAEEPLDFSSLGEDDVVLSSLPGMLAQTRILGERSLSTIWLRQGDGGNLFGRDLSDGRGPGAAAVAHMHAGKGRTLAILTDGLWRWSMLPARMEPYDNAYHLFWTRAIRWLAGGGELLPGQSIGLSLSRTTLDPGEALDLLIQTRFIREETYHPRLTVTNPNGETQAVPLYRTSDQSTKYEASLTPEIEGVYTVELESPGFQPNAITRRFAVYDPSREMLDTSADRESLAALARETGGQVFRVDHPEDLLDHLARQEESRRVSARPERVWNQPWVFAIIIFCLSVEWFWRRRLFLP